MGSCAALWPASDTATHTPTMTMLRMGFSRIPEMERAASDSRCCDLDRSGAAASTGPARQRQEWFATALERHEKLDGGPRAGWKEGDEVGTEPTSAGSTSPVASRRGRTASSGNGSTTPAPPVSITTTSSKSPPSQSPRIQLGSGGVAYARWRESDHARSGSGTASISPKAAGTATASREAEGLPDPVGRCRARPMRAFAHGLRGIRMPVRAPTRPAGEDSCRMRTSSGLFEYYPSLAKSTYHTVSLFQDSPLGPVSKVPRRATGRSYLPRAASTWSPHPACRAANQKWCPGRSPSPPPSAATPRAAPVAAPATAPPAPQMTADRTGSAPFPTKRPLVAHPRPASRQGHTRCVPGTIDEPVLRCLRRSRTRPTRARSDARPMARIPPRRSRRDFIATG